MSQTTKRDDGHVYYVIGSTGGSCDCERVPVDQALDETSTNPIANAPVAAAIAELRARKFPVDTVLNTLSANAVANGVVATAIENINAVISGFETQGSGLALNKDFSVVGSFKSTATAALSKLSIEERTISGLYTAINDLLGSLGAQDAHNITVPGEVGFTDSSYLTNNTKYTTMCKNNFAVIAPSGSSDTARGVFVSNDGKIFKGTSRSSGTWSGSVWTGSRFLAGGTEGIFTSTDGRTWSATNVTTNAGKILVVSVGTEIHCYCGKRKSTDGGLTWDGSAEDTKFGINLGAVIGTNVISHNPAGKGLLISKNGAAFEVISNTSSFNYYDIATGGGIAVAVPVEKTGKVLFSRDGESWGEIGLDSGKNYYGAYIYGGYVYVFGEDGIKYASIPSDSTFTWKSTNLADKVDSMILLSEADCYVATSSTSVGTVYVSQDGLSWFPTKFSMQTLKPIAFVDQVLFPTTNGTGIKRIPLADFKYAVGVSLRSTPVETIEELPEDFSEEEMRSRMNALISAVNKLKSICVG